MEKKNYIILGITLLVLVGMISPFLTSWNEGWEHDKNKICLPYTTRGVVFMYEGYEGCSKEEIEEKEKFIEYYCEDHSCKPIMKSEKSLEEIYYKYKENLKL